MIKIRELRVENNLLQSELAKKMNKSAVCIGDWERGRCEPSNADLIKLADIFNCSVDYLLGREDDFGIIAGNGSAVTFTKEQSELLAVFNLLPLDSQREVIGFAKALAL